MMEHLYQIGDPSVPLRSPFTVCVVITNYNREDLDLILQTNLTSKSGLICQDSKLDIG